MSYSCTENIGTIIKSHNKSLIEKNRINNKACNCQIKTDCPLEGKCKLENVVYQCTASVKDLPDKIYIGVVEGDFKKRFYNHTKSFKSRKYSKETALSNYVWTIKDQHNITPSLKWSILKSTSSYTNITQRCNLCVQEKLEILFFPNQDQLLNKRSELVSKCRHGNKFLLANYKGND